MTPAALRPCPGCDSAMQAFFAEGVEVDRCFFCGGLWFDGGELEQVLGAPVQIAALDGVSGRRCVKCRTPMGPGLLRGVPVERCGGCASVYLDDGELAQLARREVPLQRVAPAVPVQAAVRVQCRGCGDSVPVDESIRTSGGLSCRHCYGMLDQTPSTLPSARYQQSELLEVDPGYLISLARRLFG